MSGPKTLSDFEGVWHLSRIIHDHAVGRAGTLEGTARFEPDTHGLLYSEEGTLTFTDTQPLKAERRYLWRPGKDGTISVLFADGRPFHDFAFDAAEARHWCDPDTYLVTYNFGDWPRWRSLWRVEGPRKSYAMTSHYTRAT